MKVIKKDEAEYVFCGVRHDDKLYTRYEEEIREAVEWADYVILEHGFNGYNPQTPYNPTIGSQRFYLKVVDACREYGKPFLNVDIRYKEGKESLGTLALLGEIYSFLISGIIFFSAGSQLSKPSRYKPIKNALFWLSIPPFVDGIFRWTSEKYRRLVLDPLVDYRNVVSVSNIKEFVKRKSKEGGKKPKIAIIYGRKHREGFEDYLENDTLLKSQASRYSRLPLAELFLDGNVSEYNFDPATEKWKVQEYDFGRIRDR